MGEKKLVSAGKLTLLHRTPKKKMHRFPEMDSEKFQAQRTKDWTRVMGIHSEANERTSGSSPVLSTQNGSYCAVSL